MDKQAPEEVLNSQANETPVLAEDHPFKDIELVVDEITFDDLVALEDYGSQKRDDIRGLKTLLDRIVVGGVGSVKIVQMQLLFEAVMVKLQDLGNQKN